MEPGVRPLPPWFDDAKLGIFVHWTPASVPAFAPVSESPFDLAASGGWAEAMRCSPYSEWYQNTAAVEGSPTQAHHREHHGDRPYDDFVAEFLGAHDGWRPEQWADLFERAGAGYVVLVTKHHDGVLLWPSATPNPHKPRWASERDLVGDLADAVRDRGLRFGTYYSGGLDWSFEGLPITDLASMFAAIPQSEEYRAYADAHWHELIDRYRPDVLWNDIGYPAGADLEALFERYYAAVPDGVVNNRFDWIAQSSGARHCDFITPEYSTKGDPDRKWEATRGIGASFGYNREEPDSSYLDPDELVRMFVDVVARGGNLLLNVGPTAAGDIPWIQAQRLLALGWWLRTNGPAIYGTRPWVRSDGTTAEGHEVRFTAGDGALHVIVQGTPSSAEVEVLDLAVHPDATVELLGHDGPLRWSAAGTGVRIELPGRPAPVPAVVLRITPSPRAENG
jgi:alpha-L-fucosidase